MDVAAVGDAIHTAHRVLAGAIAASALFGLVRLRLSVAATALTIGGLAFAFGAQLLLNGTPPSAGELAYSFGWVMPGTGVSYAIYRWQARRLRWIAGIVLALPLAWAIAWALLWIEHLFRGA